MISASEKYEAVQGDEGVINVINQKRTQAFQLFNMPSSNYPSCNISLLNSTIINMVSVSLYPLRDRAIANNAAIIGPPRQQTGIRKLL
ncbi:hypothetical protein Scep_018986 [Stephania cephalantha]|uniref:Uncharacterized protein n=1 Tax=Stephania cephalantha TaxID=152367 RepID=A0AAP0IA53_9MAGN